MHAGESIAMCLHIYLLFCETTCLAPFVGTWNSYFDASKANIFYASDAITMLNFLSVDLLFLLHVMLHGGGSSCMYAALFLSRQKPPTPKPEETKHAQSFDMVTTPNSIPSVGPPCAWQTEGAREANSDL